MAFTCFWGGQNVDHERKGRVKNATSLLKQCSTPERSNLDREVVSEAAHEGEVIRVEK